MIDQMTARVDSIRVVFILDKTQTVFIFNLFIKK